LSQHPAQAEAAPPLRWGAEALWQLLEPLLPGLHIEIVAQIGSTNTTLLERARQSPADALVPALLVAEQQTAGRGRQGKTWHTGLGDALTFSLALPLAMRDWSGLSLAVGLALADALDPAAADQPARLGLKWPNDLLLRDLGVHAGGDAAHIGRKLGGILIETVQAGRQRIAVIGIGLNVRVLPAEALPPGLSWGRAAVQELWPAADAPAVLARVLPPLAQALRGFERDGFAPLQPGFARRDVLAGRAVTTTLPALPQGVADGVDANGTLWLRTTDGTRHPVASGDVSLRPALSPALSPALATGS
jgi:BirA family biotin operon repressor/biotin-[acetyl-CoA-carboxylase] ligase